MVAALRVPVPPDFRQAMIGLVPDRPGRLQNAERGAKKSTCKGQPNGSSFLVKGIAGQPKPRQLLPDGTVHALLGDKLMWDWMIMPLRRYADFSGRSRRKEFWSWVLFSLLVMAVPLLLIYASMDWSGYSETGRGADGVSWRGGFNGDSRISGIGIVGAGFMVLWWLATFIPNLAVTVRRLHDRNISGWAYVALTILSVIPFIGLLFSVVLLVLLCLDGTPGPNKYGPDPKGSATDIFE